MKDIFWISPPNGEVQWPLAIMLRPRGGDWLEDELLRFKQNGIEAIVTLLEPEEARWLGLGEEGALARKIGLRFETYPIPDTHIPMNIGTFRRFVAELAGRLRAGERIGVHCRGSIGRATITAACTLIHLGWKPATALAAIEAARGCPVPDTEEQHDWILHYEAGN